eukprot:1145492-Pelagomonas_calceolata.AAC.4
MQVCNIGIAAAPKFADLVWRDRAAYAAQSAPAHAAAHRRRRSRKGPAAAEGIFAARKYAFSSSRPSMPGGNVRSGEVAFPWTPVLGSSRVR